MPVVLRACVRPGGDAGLYLRFDWPDARQHPLTTPLVLGEPCGDGGGASPLATAKWYFVRHLPLRLARPRQDHKRPENVAHAAAGAGEDEGALCVQVWQRALAPGDVATRVAPLFAAAPATCEAADVLLGVAEVDLSVLLLLGQVDGWYNVHAAGQAGPRGQVKVGCSGNISSHRMLPLLDGGVPWERQRSFLSTWWRLLETLDAIHPRSVHRLRGDDAAAGLPLLRCRCRWCLSGTRAAAAADRAGQGRLRLRLVSRQGAATTHHRAPAASPSWRRPGPCLLARRRLQALRPISRQMPSCSRCVPTWRWVSS